MKKQSKEREKKKAKAGEIIQYMVELGPEGGVWLNYAVC